VIKEEMLGEVRMECGTRNLEEMRKYRNSPGLLKP
jgi:hypothetical protein